MIPFAEWRRLNIKQFPYGHRAAARKEWLRIEKEETEKKMQITGCATTTYATPNFLACTPCLPAIKYNYPAETKEEGNNPMSASYASATIAASTTETQDQRKYLAGRLEEIYRAKRNPLEKDFGLTDDDAPTGSKEFAQRIKDGKFQIRGIDIDTERNFDYWHWTDLIRWRDPSKKADQEGYAAAKEALKVKRQEALDVIKIEDPKAGLEAIKALEAWTPTGAAN